MTHALILGVNGQDGSYLADILLQRGVRVTGAARQPAARWTAAADGFDYVQADLADQGDLETLLARTTPDRIYHMAAFHGSAGHAYEAEWRAALSLNVGSVHTCLEYMRRSDLACRLFYPSSLKVFGDPPPPVIDENTPRVSSCLYSITKNAATDLIHQYRARHGAWACVGYYFNHDSPRRPDSYFLPRLAMQMIAARGTPAVAPPVDRLDFWCDWGNSREFMEMTIDLLEQDAPQDLVFATGHPVHAATLARALAAELGVPSPELPPPASATPPTVARLDGMQRAIGRLPSQAAADVARWILADRLARHSEATH
jgi:GDPmannose 4,6-dehydratase